MGLSNNKMLLIYGFEKEEKTAISRILEENKLPAFNLIDSTMGKMKIRDIINGLKLQIFNSSIPKEKLLLFNNFTDDELRKVISSIRQVLGPEAMAAVVTETSIEWTFEYLLKHLLEEREWHKNRK